jgi:hypothetical protein
MTISPSSSIRIPTTSTWTPFPAHTRAGCSLEFFTGTQEIPEGDRIMSFERFENWLERYKVAWETRDPDAAESIFTEKATYQVTPFREPEMHRDGIRAY